MSAPVILYDQPHDVYLTDESAVSASGLRDLARTPLHHWFNNRRPNRVPDPPTDAQKLGTAVHMAVLEPERFSATYTIAPKVDRRRKAGKAKWNEFVESSAGKEPMKAEEYAKVCGISKAVAAHPVSRKLLTGGKSEVSVYWTDKETGVRCRMRADYVPDSQPFLVDLKSTHNASFEAFTRTSWNFGYHLTAAFYLDGWKAATGEDRDYAFGVWETDPPHASAWYYACPDMIEAGREEYKRLLRIYAECLKADKWPGYDVEMMPLQLPAWAQSL